MKSTRQPREHTMTTAFTSSYINSSYIKLTSVVAVAAPLALVCGGFKIGGG